MRPFYDASELPRSPLFSEKHRVSRPFMADIQADHKKEKEEAKATTKKDT
ncbi:hypothetical protein SNOG_03730 [Parastagonospora nodorum SN15]|uniref:Uncharacterized protein n=1 Tax=Phaeosphaeria nodorum (strain SN15 / ATCC MYA-4574 / FGSC 10173) TaxID=321614 RepID=Q0UWY4_PHANO|nr:hypothetical protein SNOG_03730 [Parastagonospora nodorum SN15]EAT88935.1 hypothetical protein SNOG_03730 [Parastagonospora nodorum SN15]